MEMTTPVISTGGQQGPQGDKMQFPIERKYGEDPETLPLPNDSKYAPQYHLINPRACKSGCRSYMHPNLLSSWSLVLDRHCLAS